MEQMTDFQRFIKTNKLKQKQVAEYLDTSPQYISQVAKGLCNLSDEKYEKLVQGSWDVSMLNIPPYIKVPSTLTVFNPSSEERQEVGEGVDISMYPAEVVEKIREELRPEVVEEIKEEMAIPIISSEVASTPNTNIKKYIKDNGDELKRIYINDLAEGAKVAECVESTSMWPMFQPGDWVFIKFIDKDSIIDGKTYYFDLNTLPTMIRKVKIEGDKLRLIAKNPNYGDIIIGHNEVNNIAKIVGTWRSYFGDQYDEIEEVRRKKDEQVITLIEQNGKALQIIEDLIKK